MPDALPMDTLVSERKNEVRCQEYRADFGTFYELQPARSHWDSPARPLAEARVSLYAYGVSRPDDDFSAELDPDDLRALAALFVTWADACDEERKHVVPRPW
jgi:hypothetical protein